MKRSGAALITYDLVEALGVLAGSSDDTFAVFGTPAITSVTLYGRGGDDAFTVGTFNKLFHIPLDTVLGPLTVDGGDGSGDKLTLNDQAASAGKDYLIKDTHVTWDGGTTIIYSSLGSLTLNATDHDDEVTLEGTAAATTAINANDGTDVIHVTPVSRNLENAFGLTVDAGGGADLMTLNDQNNPYGADSSASSTRSPGRPWAGGSRSASSGRSSSPSAMMRSRPSTSSREAGRTSSRSAARPPPHGSTAVPETISSRSAPPPARSTTSWAT